jgi:hypothetical protein
MKRRKSSHRNALDNNTEHHLYEFHDLEQDETFKYGISSDPIGEDGLSKRMRVQLDLLNLAVGWIRYIGRVLLMGISGRKAAEEIENEYMSNFEAKHGRLPRGNKKKNRKN